MGNDTMELRRKDHGTNAPNTFKELWQDQDFADVTLATSDDRQIRAHKVIISSCSPLFRNILVKNPHQHPLIYLKGVSYEHLENALKFIYLGRCDVRDDDISAFLATAADLGIPGLMEEPNEDTKVRLKVRPNETIIHEPEYYQADLNIKIPSTNQCEKRKRSLIPAVQHEKVSYGCDQCDYKASQKCDLTRHNKSQHEGVRYGCEQCDYKATEKGHLTKHKQAKHEGVRYLCDQCSHKVTSHTSLARHKQTKHEGVKYGCDQCDYKATENGSLTKHKQAQHQGVRYNCDQCDYKATTQNYLTKHKQVQHEGVRYNCDQCEYKATTKGHLNEHKRRIHYKEKLSIE
jgi:predicted RNA-binding Zn-ribbon protein involved in translation (DUF1610 family)